MYMSRRSCIRGGRPIWGSEWTYDGICASCRSIIKWVGTPLDGTSPAIPAPLPLPDDFTAPSVTRQMLTVPCVDCRPLAAMDKAIQLLEERIEGLFKDIERLKEPLQ